TAGIEAWATARPSRARPPRASVALAIAPSFRTCRRCMGVSSTAVGWDRRDALDPTIGSGIAPAELREALEPELAGVAAATGGALRRWIVAAQRHRVVHPELGAALDDLRLGEGDERRVDAQALPALDGGPGREVRHALVGADVFGAA